MSSNQGKSCFSLLLIMTIKLNLCNVMCSLAKYSKYMRTFEKPGKLFRIVDMGYGIWTLKNVTLSRIPFHWIFHIPLSVYPTARHCSTSGAGRGRSSAPSGEVTRPVQTWRARATSQKWPADFWKKIGFLTRCGKYPLYLRENTNMFHGENLWELACFPK